MAYNSKPCPYAFLNDLNTLQWHYLLYSNYVISSTKLELWNQARALVKRHFDEPKFKLWLARHNTTKYVKIRFQVIKSLSLRTLEPGFISLVIHPFSGRWYHGHKQCTIWFQAYIDSLPYLLTIKTWSDNLSRNDRNNVSYLMELINHYYISHSKLVMIHFKQILFGLTKNPLS